MKSLCLLESRGVGRRQGMASLFRRNKVAMKCLNAKCREDVPEHLRNCVVCGADAGYPNVRMAERAAEMQSLERRFQDALQQATIKGSEQVTEQFRVAVGSSEAIISRPLSKLMELVSSDNELYTTYYHQVESQSRLPQANEYDQGRTAIDSVLFPNYHAEIRFAMLSLDARGLDYYGECSIALKEMAIQDRATVFEGNSFEFFQEKKIVAGKQPPLGYRTTWKNRDRLAVSKLGVKIDTSTTPSLFPGILISNATGKGDFVEVHIYGPIHRRAIKSVVVKQPNKKADKTLLKSMRNKLAQIGASLKVEP